MNRTIAHGALAAAILVAAATAAATAEPGHNCVWTGGAWAGQGPCPGMPPASEPAEPSEPVDTRTETLVQVCEPDLWVSIWRDAGVLDSIGIQWPNDLYDSRTRPGPVRVNGIELDPAGYIWGESAWFTTVQDPIDADSVLIQYGTCAAMIAEDGGVTETVEPEPEPRPAPEPQPEPAPEPPAEPAPAPVPVVGPRIETDIPWMPRLFEGTS